MKLNAGILKDNLKKSLRMEIYGKSRNELRLRRPEFFDRNSMVFQSDHVYIALASQLPVKPILEENAMVICVGGRPPSFYYSLENGCCFILDERAELLTVFNSVQHIYDRYEEWEDSIRKILDTTADIQEMLDCSQAILENPVVVTDFDYHFIAYSKIINENEELALYRPDENNQYSPQRLAGSMGKGSTSRNMEKPFLAYLEGSNIVTFIKNLFYRESYIGCIKIPFVVRLYRESDYMIACTLARYVEQAFVRNANLQNDYVNPLVTVLREVLEGIPIEANRMYSMIRKKLNGQHLCVRISIVDKSADTFPIRYLLNYAAKPFADAVAFEYEGYIVLFINLKRQQDGLKGTLQLLEGLLGKLHLKAGISSPFGDLNQARTYYRQSAIAAVMGNAINPKKNGHFFEEYKLRYMCNSSMGEFSLESMIPEGVRNLVSHDRNAQVKYVKTLRTYLNNNMNITKSARELFLHRSTFIERIERIKSMLGLDLEAFDQRLYLQMILKQMELMEEKERLNQASDENEAGGEKQGAISKIVFPEESLH